MAMDYFSLVERIVEERKYFDISRNELVRLLETKGEADIEDARKFVESSDSQPRS